MEMCRACLLTDNNLIPLDDSFVESFNLLTNLCVTLGDDFPQYSCQNCVDILKMFVVFREKAIESEISLQDAIKDIKPDILEYETKTEVEDNSNIEIKTEFKLDYNTSNDFIESNNCVDFALLDKYSETETHEEKKVNKRKYTIKKINKINNNEIKKGKKDNKVAETSTFSCGLCKIKFEEHTALSKHLEVHMKHTQCEICSEKFTPWQQLFGHRIKHLPTKERRCHICNKRFATCEGLQYHYSSVHTENQGNDISLECKICSKFYATPRKLKKHIFSVHPANDYKCDICSKSFNSKNNLRVHKVSHLDIKAFKCELCEFSCKRRSGLKEHIVRRHTAEKVTCRKCNRVFKDQQSYDKHNCGVVRTICPICGKEIGPRMKQHLEAHAADARFACSRCPRAFRSRAARRAHEDRHRGVRALVCRYCPAAFYSASARTRHHRTHTGEKPYVCEICDRAFMSNSIRKTHMKVHGLFIINHKNKDMEDKNDNDDSVQVK